jgi:Calcineurin-like phosphoesterase
VRKSEDYLNLSRSPAVNHLKTELNKSEGASSFYKTKDFVTKHLWTWIYHYLKSRFGARHPYQDYKSPQTGIYRLEKTRHFSEASTTVNANTGSASTGKHADSLSVGHTHPSTITIGIVSDWATGTPEAREIGLNLKTKKPDYTVHLGDTYFVGTTEEIEANFGQGNWPRGNTATFALLGNHEMYSRGIAFFDKLLPSLGLRTGDDVYEGQQAGFFCLENDHWRILGLDTGYHSITKVPGLEMFSWFAGDGHFDPILMNWLKNTVKLGDLTDKRGLLILTHHQYISGFRDESEFQMPASQLASLIGKDRPVIWLWGHEHKLSVFEKAQVGDGITAYGRCIGHGGMPIELNGNDFIPSARRKGFPKLLAFDKRQKGIILDTPVGHNGYVLAKIMSEQLVLEYRDEKKALFWETWKVDTNGKITGTIQSSPDLELVCGKVWEDAVR